MTHFLPSPRPSHSPWGTIDHADQIVPGVWSVGTPSHGGFLLSPERQAAMPTAVRRDGSAYEEDVDWCLVALVFGNEFTGIPCGERTMAEIARDHARNHCPDEYAAVTGHTPTAETSMAVRRRETYVASLGEFVVTSAFGDWADWVPRGKVGIYAREATGVSQAGFLEYGKIERRGLVDASRYDSRKIVNLWKDLGPELLDQMPSPPTFRKSVALTTPA